jgi:hypothetical protein
MPPRARDHIFKKPALAHYWALIKVKWLIIMDTKDHASRNFLHELDAALTLKVIKSVRLNNNAS